LKDNIFQGDDVFDYCVNLSTVDVVGGIHKTISSLHMESWRNEMREEIDRINRVLPTTFPLEKTSAIQLWIRTSFKKNEHFKSEHYMLLKKAMAPLELALWRAKLLDENEEGHSLGEKQPTKRCKMNDEAARRNEQRITSGASVVITNVLPFLALA